MRYVPLFILALFCCRPAVAQQLKYYPSYKGAAVVQGGDSLHTPWAGGLLNPQFSEMDLNGDGSKDLVVFEPYDNQILTFIYDGFSQYHYAPEYEQGFPPATHFMLLRDYDKDGKEDLFTYSMGDAGGTAVYHNVSQGRHIAFQLVTKQLPYQDVNFSTNLYIPSTDIPVITDLDGDGDMDILAFDVLQYYVYYYKNMSMETYHKPDSLDFVIDQRGWGKFELSASDNTVILGAIKRKAHGGSNMLIDDFDGDGDKDLLLADISYAGIMLLENGRIRSGKPNLKLDSIASVDTLWPTADTRAYIPFFPAAFEIDVDHDGLEDILVSPQQLTGSNDYKQVFYYRNTGTAQKPQYTLIQKDFLQAAMVDEGTHCAPALYDLNGDGLTDMVIATKGNTDGPYAYDKLVYYLNTGSKAVPVMKKMSDDFGSLKQRKESFLRPCFGDLNGDGLPDMLVGKADGKLLYYKNTGLQNNIPQMQLVSDTFMGIGAGGYSAPYLADVDKDGLPDLILGKRDGTISYYKNTGTHTQPAFTLVTDTLGRARTNRYYYEYIYNDSGRIVDSTLRKEAFGGSCPVVMDLDHDGKLDLLSGSLRENLFFYFDIEDQLSGRFSRRDSLIYNHVYNNMEPGSFGVFAVPAAGQLDADSIPDLIIGNYRGGAYYEGSQVDPTGIRNYPSPTIDFKLYPNPAKQELYVETTDENISQAMLMNMLGQPLRSYPVQHSRRLVIDVSSLPEGIYFLQLSRTDGSSAVKKVVVEK